MAMTLVHLQERCWVMSCSAAYELAEHSCEVFPQCSHRVSLSVAQKVS
jgi:hypothetical protein